MLNCEYYWWYNLMKSSTLPIEVWTDYSARISAHRGFFLLKHVIMFGVACATHPLHCTSSTSIRRRTIRGLSGAVIHWMLFGSKWLALGTILSPPFNVTHVCLSCWQFAHHCGVIAGLTCYNAAHTMCQFRRLLGTRDDYSDCQL